MKKSKKIFFVDPMSYKNLAQYDYSLITNIAGIDINFYGSTLYDIKDDKLSIIKIYDYSTKSGYKKILSYCLSQNLLIKDVKLKRPKIVHFQWFKFTLYDVFTIKRIKALGSKVIFTAHNLLPHEGFNRYSGVYRVIYSLVDIIIVHAEKTAEELVLKFNIPSKKIRVIPHGILTHGTLDKIKLDNYVKRFKNKNVLINKTVFAVLGEMMFYKGLDVVIDAWNQPQLDSGNIALILAGKGNFKKIKEIEDKENVLVLNRFLEIEEFMAIVKIADFIILPYRRISQSGVLLTVLSEKKSIIVSDVGGLTEPFKFGNIGYILESLTPEVLADTIQKAFLGLSKKNHQDEEDIRVWESIFNYYDWKNIGEKTKQLYCSF